VWYGGPEDHVARADQLDFSLIGILAGWRAKRTDQDQANTFRVVRKWRDLDNVSVENIDPPWIELASGARLSEHEAIGLLFLAHAVEPISVAARFANPST